MNNRSKEIFFPLFALFVIFSDELFYSIMSILDILLESGMKGRFAMVIAGVAYLMMAGDFFNNKFNKKNRNQFVVLTILFVLYVLTGFFYSQANPNYNAALLVYGALCVPAAYVGMRLARGGYEDAMLRYLPYCLILMTMIIGYAVINGFAEGRMLGNEQDNGLNYQNSSYYLSYCCAYSVFCFFFMKGERRNLWNKLLYLGVSVLIFVCAIGTIVGGGRGAFVYLVLISAYLVFRITGKGKGSSKLNNFLMLAAVIVVMIFLANRFDIFDSSGARRVSENMFEDDGRAGLTRKSIQSFIESPLIGHGVGSVWWEVGFYSHNIVQDFLVEIGSIGALIMVIVIVKILIRLVQESKYSNFGMFMLIMLTGHLLQDAFSGYWFSSFPLFLAFGYVYGKKWPRVTNIKNIRISRT